MSKESWLAAHYPKPAEECIGSELEAVEHAILKFEGLKPEALELHQVKMLDAWVVTLDEYDPVLHFSCETCVLCHLHDNPDEAWDEHLVPDCEECILYKVRGQSCDNSDIFYQNGAPYQEACYHNNPVPMLELLHSAKHLLGDY